MAKFSPEEWQAELFRLTVFPELGEMQRDPTWWEAITGEPPEESTSNPKKGTSGVHGLYREGKLHLTSAPDRIDWVYIANVMEEPPTIDLPTVGTLREALPVFMDIGDRWLSMRNVPEINRMAFGSVLTHREENREAAYSRVADYVPIRISPQSSDLIYQINVAADSKTGIEGLKLNRLSKWSGAALKSLELNMGDVSGVRARMPELVAIRVEFDINTMPGTGPSPLPRAKMLDLFHELMSEAETLAVNGVVV